MDKVIILFCLILPIVYSETNRGLLEAIFGSAAVKNSETQQANGVVDKTEEAAEGTEKKDEKLLHLLSSFHDSKHHHHHHSSHDTIKIPIPTFQQVVIHKPHPKPIHIVKPAPEHIYIHEEKPHKEHYHEAKPEYDDHKPSHLYTNDYHIPTKPESYKPHHKPVYVSIDHKPSENTDYDHKPIYVIQSSKPDYNEDKPQVEHINHKPIPVVIGHKPISVHHPTKPVEVFDHKPISAVHHDTEHGRPIILQIMGDKPHESVPIYVIRPNENKPSHKPSGPVEFPSHKPQYIFIENSNNDHEHKPNNNHHIASFGHEVNNHHNPEHEQKPDHEHKLDHEHKPDHEQKPHHEQKLHYEHQPDQDDYYYHDYIHQNKKVKEAVIGSGNHQTLSYDHKPIYHGGVFYVPDHESTKNGEQVTVYKPLSGSTNPLPHRIPGSSDTIKKPINFWDLITKPFQSLQNGRPTDCKNTNTKPPHPPPNTKPPHPPPNTKPPHPPPNIKPPQAAVKPVKYILKRKSKNDTDKYDENEDSENSRESEDDESDEYYPNLEKYAASPGFPVNPQIPTLSSVLLQSWLPKQLQDQSKSEILQSQLEEEEKITNTEMSTAEKESVTDSNKTVEDTTEDDTSVSESRSSKLIGESMTQSFSQHW